MLKKRAHWKSVGLVGALAFAFVVAGPVFAQEEAAPPATEAEAADTPRISFESTTIDLGEVPKGENAEYDFIFVNTGTSVLEIEEAKPACGCTVADYTKTVAPGETGKIHASIDTKRFRGPITKSITVSSNDPVDSKISLQAKATVKPFVDVLPSQHVFLRTDRGQVSSKQVTLVSHEEELELTIDKVDSSSELVSVVWAAVEEGQTDEDGETIEGDYTIDITLSDKAPVGRVNGTVDVFTNSEKAEKITLQVRGNVRGLVQVRPSRVFLGNLDTTVEEPVVKTVRVTARGEGNIAVEKVESSFAAITSKITVVEEGKSYDIELEIKGDLPQGPLDEVVTIFTNDKDEAEIEVKIRGQVG